MVAPMDTLRSRRQPLDQPCVVGLPGVVQAIVQAVFTAVPELNDPGCDAISSPIGWSWDVVLLIAFLQLFQPGFEHLAAADDLALLGG
jgi:hypothetical protein